MSSTPFTRLRSAYVVLPTPNIDTDQIIPARYLKTTERSGLGAHAFHDWRHASDGSLIAGFPLNDPSAQGAQVLVAGRNFGCGSSREHAVWALLGAGFRAVVSAEFADIFRGNALSNGLLPVQVEPRFVDALIETARSAPPGGARAELSVDLETQTLRLPWGDAVTFPISPFAKHCLLRGIDELDFLLGVGEDVAAYERSHALEIDVAIRTRAP